MAFRIISGVFFVLSVWSAYLQLNDPDPERWTAMYLACAAVALLSMIGRPVQKLSIVVCAIAFAWALAILPELIGRWHPSDLTAKMVPERPEIEFGREFFGLLIVAGYTLGSFLYTRKKAAS